MSAAVLTFLVFGVLIFSPVSLQNEPILQKLLSAVEKLVHYYQQTYQHMNLDGIFGLRALEGQLSLILNDIASRRIHSIEQEVVQKLERLHHISASVSNKSLAHLIQADADYFRRMQILVQKPFKFAKPYRQIKPHLKWRESEHKTGSAGFDEDFSDGCMAELMGSDGHTRCDIGEACLHTMTAPGYGDYFITHQLLYTILAEQSGCLSVLDQKLKMGGYIGGVDALQDELCTNNFYEIAEMVQGLKGNLIPRTQDLFMEQELVCPMLGYMDFLHADWLQQIISWQSPNGCYGKMRKSDLARFSKDNYEYKGEYLESDSEQRNNQNRNDEIDFIDKAFEGELDPMHQQQQHIELRHYQQYVTGTTVNQGNSNIDNQNNVIQNHVNQRKMNHNIEQSNVVIQQPNGNLQTIVGNSSGINKRVQVTLPRQNVNPVINKVLVNDNKFELSNNQLQFKPNNNQHYKFAGQKSSGVVQHKLNQGYNLVENQQTKSINGMSQNLEDSRYKLDNAKRQIDNLPPNKDGGMPGQRDEAGRPVGHQGWWESRLQRPSPHTEGAPPRRQEGAPARGQEGSPISQNEKPQIKEGLPPRGHIQSPSRQKEVLDRGQHGTPQRQEVAPPTKQTGGTPVKLTKQAGLPRVTADHLHVQPDPRQGRKLLFEKHLKDGCLSHKTAVAAGALSQYLKFVLDPGPPEYQAVVQLTGTNYLMAAKHRFAPELPDTQQQQAGNNNNEELHFQENEKHVLKRPNIPPIDDQEMERKSVGVPGNQDLGYIKTRIKPGKAPNNEDEREYGDHQENPPQDYYKDQINANIKESEKLDRKPPKSNQDKVYSEKDRGDYVDEDYDEQDKKDKHRKELHEAGLDAGDKEYEQYIDNDENGFNQNKPDEHGENGNGDPDNDQYAEDTDEKDMRAANINPKFTSTRRTSKIDGMNKDKGVKQAFSDDAYSYYDNGHEKIHPDNGNRGDDLLDDVEDGGAAEEGAMKQTHKFDLTNSIGKTYLLLLIAMLVLLFFMYRFIRRRRVLIRYRYR